MTTNVNVNLTKSWTNISSAAGLSAGQSFVAQVESSGVILKNSISQPTNKEGGLETQDDLKIVSCEPDASEFVWGIAENGNVLVRVQS